MNKQTVKKENQVMLDDTLCIWVNTENVRMPVQEFIKKNPEHNIPVGTAILIDLWEFLFYKTPTGWVQSRLGDPDNIPTYVTTHTSFKELVEEVVRRYNED